MDLQMKVKEFFDWADEQHKIEMDIMLGKGREYTMNDIDKLKNFKFIAERLKDKPEKIAMVYLLKQREHTNAFLFCEWNERPQRLLIPGDKVKVNTLGILEYWELIDLIKSSKFNGFYADIRKYVNLTPNTSKYKLEEKGTK